MIAFFDINLNLFYDILVLFFNRGIKMEEVDYLDQVKDPFSGFVELESDGIPVYNLHCSDVLWHKIAIIFLAGSSDEIVKGSGVAHFLEHVIVRQCEQRIKGLSGLFLEGRATTAFNYTCYIVEGHKDIIEGGYAEMVESISHPDYALMDNERSIILSEAFSSRSIDGQERSFRHRRAFGTDYFDIAGDYEKISSVDRKMMEDFHRKMYTLENAMIVSMGAISGEELIGICNRHLLKIPWADTIQQSLNTPYYMQDFGNTLISTHSDNRMAVIRLFFMLASTDRCLSAISCRMIKAIIYEKLREKEGIVYSVENNWINHSYFQEAIFLIKGIPHHQLNRVISLIKESLAEVKTRQDILEKVKMNRLRGYLYVDRSNDDIFDSAIWKVSNLGYIEEERERVRRELNVSMEQVVEFMKMFSLDKMFMNIHVDHEDTVDINLLP